MLSFEINIFYSACFLSLEIKCFFRNSAIIQYVLGRKKHVRVPLKYDKLYLPPFTSKEMPGYERVYLPLCGVANTPFLI